MKYIFTLVLTGTIELEDKITASTEEYAVKQFSKKHKLSRLKQEFNATNLAIDCIKVKEENNGR